MHVDGAAVPLKNVHVSSAKAQMSLGLTVYEIGAPKQLVAGTVSDRGSDKTGGTVSVTVKLKLQLDVKPTSSVAVQLAVMVSAVSAKKLGGLQTTETCDGAEQASLAVAVKHCDAGHPTAV